MNRRKFAGCALAAAFAGKSVFGVEESKVHKLKFAPNIYKWTNLFPVSCKGLSEVDQIKFFHDLGFIAFEDNDMAGRPVEIQKAMGNELERLGMEMGTFTSYNGGKDFYMSSNRENGKQKPDKKAALSRTRETMEKSVEVAKRSGAKYTTVVPAKKDDSIEFSYQLENVAEHLKVAAEVCEKANLTMLLEPLSFTNHPGLLVQKISDAYLICKMVGSPNCKILFDVFHQQETEGSLFRNIDAAWDEIGYFHLGDSPKRTEPLSGEINYKNLIKKIYDKGYVGIYGMEHKLSDKSKAGEEKMLKAYGEIERFVFSE